MRVNGETAPASAFTLEYLPKSPGRSLARFYENATVEETSWTWDEYHLELESYPGLAQDIEANYAEYLTQAKLLDESLSLEDRVYSVEEDTKTLTEAVNILLGVSV